jgi:hypothetical protein
MLGLILQSLIVIVMLVCFILVVVQMFQHGQTGLGIACSVGFFVCGLGTLLAFIYGWIKVNEWNIQNIMYAWTGCWLLGIILSFVFGVSFTPTMPAR